MYAILKWLDLYIFQCHWRWLCDYLWDMELARDDAFLPVLANEAVEEYRAGRTRPMCDDDFLIG